MKTSTLTNVNKLHPTYLWHEQNNRYQDITFLRKKKAYFDSQNKNTANCVWEDMAARVILLYPQEID